MFLWSEMHTDALLVPLSLFCSLTQQTASSLPLHLVRNDLQQSALGPLFYSFCREQLMQIFLCWGRFFVLHEARHKSPLTVSLPPVSLLMVHMAAVLLLHTHFSSVSVCTLVWMSAVVLTWSPFKCSADVFIYSLIALHALIIKLISVLN